MAYYDPIKTIHKDDKQSKYTYASFGKPRIYAQKSDPASADGTKSEVWIKTKDGEIQSTDTFEEKKPSEGDFEHWTNAAGTTVVRWKIFKYLDLPNQDPSPYVWVNSKKVTIPNGDVVHCACVWKDPESDKKWLKVATYKIVQFAGLQSPKLWWFDLSNTTVFGFQEWIVNDGDEFGFSYTQFNQSGTELAVLPYFNSTFTTHIVPWNSVIPGVPLPVKWVDYADGDGFSRQIRTRNITGDVENQLPDRKWQDLRNQTHIDDATFKALSSATTTIHHTVHYTYIIKAGYFGDVLTVVYLINSEVTDAINVSSGELMFFQAAGAFYTFYGIPPPPPPWPYFNNPPTAEEVAAIEAQNAAHVTWSENINTLYNVKSNTIRTGTRIVTDLYKINRGGVRTTLCSTTYTTTINGNQVEDVLKTHTNNKAYFYGTTYDASQGFFYKGAQFKTWAESIATLGYTKYVPLILDIRNNFFGIVQYTVTDYLESRRANVWSVPAASTPGFNLIGAAFAGLGYPYRSPFTYFWNKYVYGFPYSTSVYRVVQSGLSGTECAVSDSFVDPGSSPGLSTGYSEPPPPGATITDPRYSVSSWVWNYKDTPSFAVPDAPSKFSPQMVFIHTQPTPEYYSRYSNNTYVYKVNEFFLSSSNGPIGSSYLAAYFTDLSISSNYCYSPQVVYASTDLGLKNLIPGDGTFPPSILEPVFFDVPETMFRRGESHRGNSVCVVFQDNINSDGVPRLVTPNTMFYATHPIGGSSGAWSTITPSYKILDFHVTYK